MARNLIRAYIRYFGNNDAKNEVEDVEKGKRANKKRK